MNVRLDPQQVPARAELLLAAAFGEDAPGRPIYARPKPDEHDGGERIVRSEGTVRPSGSVCGNPLRGTRDTAPVVPIGAPLVTRTDGPDVRGWLTERRAAAATSPAVALRRAVEKQPGHANAGAPRRQPARVAVDPSTPTTQLDPP